MTIHLTQAELGEAMRRLAAQEGHKPTVFRDEIICRAGNPRVEARRARARELRDNGLQLTAILAMLGEEGMATSLSSLKHDLSMTL
jgi:hypothetical protein